MRAIAMTTGLLAAVLILAPEPARAADKYNVDPAHTAVVFKIEHGGFSWTYGRFNDVSGTFTIDAKSPESSQVAVIIKTDSLDTGNPQREGHLKSPDFFNAKQFPSITFKSTSVSKAEKGLTVVGDLTLHGVTKPVTLHLVGGKVGEFPKGVQRTGYSTELSIKRSEFGMDKMIPAAGDEVVIMISFEGTRP
ncbi:YceI family protein [Paludisphaera mucosa]|uniref:YceI family protein n=1 Tax=Paludisphaera mucosa TaxID=3030827 RepID=A0ABT6F4P1_9BACT|nr:YceI family protein [Paludisphaera mucosa]MDG3002471.1 YceI family protein [Paludisphaera mucosa]